MPTRTPNIDMKYLTAGQSSAEATHNDALNVLDVLVQPTIIDKDLNVPPGSPANGDRYLVFPKKYAITAVVTGTDTLTIAGDQTSFISVGDKFFIEGSTGNNGTWTVDTVTFNSPDTDIVTIEDITDGTADGDIVHAQDDWNVDPDGVPAVRMVALYYTAWILIPPAEGWVFWVQDEDAVYQYDGAEWVPGVRIPVLANATRGAAGTAGRLIWNTDDTALNFDDGTDWKAATAGAPWGTT